MYLGFPVCPVPVSIECAETPKKKNKTLAGRSQGRRKRYWRGTGVTQNTVFVGIVTFLGTLKLQVFTKILQNPKHYKERERSEGK